MDPLLAPQTDDLTARQASGLRFLLRKFLLRTKVLKQEVNEAVVALEKIERDKREEQVRKKIDSLHQP